jgi:probable phosphoglycerate mutase
MKNEYFILRHGHSKANEAKIILSHLEDGKLEEFTLTEKGEEQVRNSAAKAKAEGALDETAVIISSPFSRCKRTAEIAREVLGVAEPVIFDDRLRERWFGNWERKGNDNYDKVWEIDKIDPDHKIELVESANDVQARTAALIEDCENKYDGKKIVLVSHGDALQILQTWFKKVSPARHRELTHLETAEIRKVS